MPRRIIPFGAVFAGAALSSQVAFAGVTADIAVESCLARLNLPAKACGCIGMRAETELSAAQQDFFIAMISRDPASQAPVQSDLSVEEMTEVANFMKSARRQCTGG